MYLVEIKLPTMFSRLNPKTLFDEIVLLHQKEHPRLDRLYLYSAENERLIIAAVGELADLHAFERGVITALTLKNWSDLTVR